MDVSKNEENPLKMDDLGVPFFFGNTLKWMFKGYKIFFPNLTLVASGYLGLIWWMKFLGFNQGTWDE